jgi:hypothetical protein
VEGHDARRGCDRAAERVWTMSFPFFARRRWCGRRLQATNADWERGDGDVIDAPIETLLLVLTGRRVGQLVS